MNHNSIGQRSLHDPIWIMICQLRALGHRAEWLPKNDALVAHYIDPDAPTYNVLVEGFTEPMVEVIAKAHGNGARFIYVATEEPTEQGFNHGIDPAMVERQKVFPKAAKYCEGILHLVPGKPVTDWYGQWAPSAQAELGYAPDLVRWTRMPEPTWDFGFFGSVTKRRHAILKKLAKGSRHGVKIVPDFKDQKTRDEIVKTARIVLQIRKFDKMDLVSSSRCNTALCLGRPIIAEPHAYAHPWDQIVKFSSSLDAFYNDAWWMLLNWKTVHQQQFEKFKTTLTPEFCLGEPLRKIGIESPAMLAKQLELAS